MAFLGMSTESVSKIKIDGKEIILKVFFFLFFFAVLDFLLCTYYRYSIVLILSRDFAISFLLS